MREIKLRYQDPVEIIWIRMARELGIRVERDCTVFASWDGARVLRIGTPDTLDADDCLAQMILHEICHALVEGPESFYLPDWGIENHPSQRVHEHACLRLQAALADTCQLREFLASTTMFRAYYDQLPDDPLRHDGDPAVELALQGWRRSRQPFWSRPLDRALQATSEIARLLDGIAPSDSLWSTAHA